MDVLTLGPQDDRGLHSNYNYLREQARTRPSILIALNIIRYDLNINYPKSILIDEGKKRNNVSSVELKYHTLNNC